MLKSTMSDVYDLPDELLLEIVNNFRSIRSYEPQSTAFKNKTKERTRQRKNRVRQFSLCSLCLTSRRFRGISTPVLYASFLSTTTWHSFAALVNFHRTISAPGNGYGLSIRLADCLTYIEDRFADHLGNSLEQDSRSDGATNMVSRYFLLLSEIVSHARNLEHLSVVCIESYEISFWGRIIPLKTGIDDKRLPTKVAKHGFPKLQTLCVQIHDQDRFGGTNIEDVWFHRVCGILKDLPLLSEFRASDMSSTLFLTPPLGEFKTLQRLELTMCSLELNDVTDLLVACQRLRHFTCMWVYCYDDGVAISDLYPGLLRHEKCLKTLVLDIREVRFVRPPGSPPHSLGSLRSFLALESLVICETSLMSSNSHYLMFPEQFHDRHIADLLPESLRELTILTRTDESTHINSLDQVSALWHLVEDCTTVLPRLRIVNIQSGHSLSATELQAAFSEVGVQFNTLIQA